MKFLLDTCIISELARQQPSTRVTHWIEQQDEFSMFLSVITFGELQKGLNKLPDSRKRHRLQDWVRNELSTRFTGRVLAINREIAVKWGEISAAAEGNGRSIPVLDGLLAATSLVSGLTFVTRNTQHVQISGASLFNPWAL